ncbi:DUF2538 family protein [Macrococcus sp. DPC7161]|uniref:DUF2538 family protein n=1 Tax=Macrococcus sp. DPC7161 TaxID=2507060 RepID=UPI00100BD78E|nr:DUF2538 family protein [Macrococcus sp. DPC7161]RXK18793.1 DUF2538 family protein [Macrococcus sp. DPC7161]
MRKTYEKYAQINKMFDVLEHQITAPNDEAYVRDTYYFINFEHRQNYESLLIYYSDAVDNPIMDGACYILSIPEIFSNVSIFEYEVPLDFVFENGQLSATFTNLDVYYQYLVAAVLEVSDVHIFKPSGYTMGMTHWNINQLRLFWQYTAIIRKDAL